MAQFTRFCVEKNFVKNWIGGEIMTNMRYAVEVNRESVKVSRESVESQ